MPPSLNLILFVDLKDFQNSSENKNLIATMYLSILDAVSSLLTEDNDREFWVKLFLFYVYFHETIINYLLLVIGD